MIRDHGLSQTEINSLNNVFTHYSAIELVKLYGSRAKGTFNDRSDIDLVAYGETLNQDIVAQVLLDLDDTDIPYLIDFQYFDSLKNHQLIEHINRVGILLYDKVQYDIELSMQQLHQGEGIAMDDAVNEISAKYE